MRIWHRYLTFDRNEKLITFLNKLTVKHTITEKSFDATTHFYALEFHLYEDNPRFSELKEAVNRFNITPQVGTIFEKEDFAKAEWFIASTGQYQYPQPEEDFGYLNATFNLANYCMECGIGKTQDAPYRLKTEPKQYNNQFWGLHWDYDAIFVREETKNIFEKENIKGISFSQPVLHKKNLKVDSFHQLHIENSLEQGFDDYNTQIITCKFNNEEKFHTDKNAKYCGRNKFHYPMIGGFLFDKAIFNPEYDIVKSREYFGSGASANKLLIVSKKIKSIIDSYKLKGLYLTPIIHERFIR